MVIIRINAFALSAATHDPSTSKYIYVTSPVTFFCIAAISWHVHINVCSIIISNAITPATLIRNIMEAGFITSFLGMKKPTVEPQNWVCVA